MTKKNWKADWPRPNTLFSNRLHDILPNKGMSKIAQEYFLGASKNTVFKYLSGDSEPTVSQVLRVAEVAGCNAMWLLTGGGKPFGKEKGIGMGEFDGIVRENLCGLRKSKGDAVIEKWLSGATNFTLNDWKQWERGEGIPGHKVLEAIAEASGMNVNDFYAKPDNDIAAQVEIIFRLQESISHVQLRLASAGRHVAGGQSLRAKEDAGDLGKYAQSLVSQLQHLLTLIQVDGNPHEAAKNQPIPGGSDGDQNHSA